MSHPPLDAPPFEPAAVRRCIKVTVRIQNHDSPQEVLILTSMNNSIQSMLRSETDGEGMDGDSHSSLSGSFSTSSEEETDDDMEVGDEDDGRQVSGSNSNGDRNSPQCSEPAQNRAFRMKAFWKKRLICENPRGAFKISVYYAKVLHKADLNWIETDEEVAIKQVSWNCIRACRNRLSEDFVKEIEALHYISQFHQTEMAGRSMMDTHVMAADTVMSNESHLYIVMPYCAGGDLCERVAFAENSRLTEEQSRFWFRQILQGLETLQLMRICHKDLTPENVILLDNNSLLIDFGMCLRIPYSEAGMHLIKPVHPCGKLPHICPEIYMSRPLDGHAVDIWAAGTILLFMLTGKRLEKPPLVDRAFDSVDLGISYEAMDLLRKMFRLDPNNRLSLGQIRDHPFVRYEFVRADVSQRLDT
ncbi:hypothetical protein ACHAXR_004675 [Thalassiosira sp. AJA248-18]